MARAKKKYRRSCLYAIRAVMASLNSSESIKLSFVFNPPHNRNYDKDNLIAQMKSGIDGIADALGVDDQYFDIGSIELGQRVVGGEVLVSIEW